MKQIVLVATLALLIAACSSGAVKPSTPTVVPMAQHSPDAVTTSTSAVTATATPGRSATSSASATSGAAALRDDERRGPVPTYDRGGAHGKRVI